MKLCPKCNTNKNESEFIKVKKPRWKGDEYSSWCRVCNNKRARDYYFKHKERELLRHKKRWANYSTEDKLAKLEIIRKYYLEKRLVVLKYYGNKCACCGETTREFLEIDHKNNDGSAHRKTLKGRNIIVWIIENNYPDMFQILCSNCNMSKGRWGYCPHNKKK